MGFIDLHSINSSFNSFVYASDHDDESRRVNIR